MAKDENNKTDMEKMMARRRRRSVALACVLGVVVLIFYALTIVKMGPGLFERVL